MSDAVAVVVRLGLFMLVETKMVIQFRVQRCLNGDFGQHLPKLVEVFFRLDILCSRLRDCLKLFLLHYLPILTRNRVQ
jgi:hypothetical protein